MTVARTLVAASLLFVMAAPARAASTGWTVFDVAPPGGSVASLAAIGGTDVWAVGLESGGACQYQTLAQRWTGSNWTVVPTPNVPGVNSVLADRKSTRLNSSHMSNSYAVF